MEFTLKTILNATAKDIYTAWLNSEKHSIMTGGDTITSDKLGDSFSVWDGYIHGKNLILEENKRIVQSWRTSEFEKEEEDSQIEILLSEQDMVTELTLIHSNVPDGGEHYKKGWVEHYFEPMRAHFINQ